MLKNCFDELRDVKIIPFSYKHAIQCYCTYQFQLYIALHQKFMIVFSDIQIHCNTQFSHANIFFCSFQIRQPKP